ncbi:MAG: NFACT family protein [Betaproteobacteria bacterium]
MTFDGMVMAAVAAELRELTEGARVDSIYQPRKLDVLIVARRPGRGVAIIASAEASCARVHVSTAERENPPAPPAFCMLLRKHLIGARITRVAQRGLDRVLEIGFVGPYDDPPKTLIIEIMARHSNIILVDDRSGLVLDSIKHIGPAQSRVRTVRPGSRYAPPPSQEKLDPLRASASEFSEVLELLARDLPELPCEEFLTRAFTGLGRDSARVIVSRAGLGGQGSSGQGSTRGGGVSAPAAPPISGLDSDGAARLWAEFSRTVASVREGRFSPCAGLDRETGDVAWISVIGPPAQPPAEASAAEEQVAFPTVGALLDYAFTPREKALTLVTASLDVSRAVSTAIDRLRRKLAVQEEEIREADRADEFRRAGELISANAQIIERGRSVAEVVDYFDPQLRKVEVELDPRLSPHENAQEYFKKYARAKRRLAVAKEQADLTRAELEYLEQVAVTIEQAESLEAIEEIRRELADEGYLSRPKRERPRAQKHEAPSPSGPLRFDVEGNEVLVGRNNTENDFLTLKIARPNDIWLHARGVPGAHVVIRVRPGEAQEVSDRVLVRAAEIAAYYSKARSASKAAVDYTLRKHVRKPRGARPGMVIYDHEKTIVAAPRPPQGSA